MKNSIIEAQNAFKQKERPITQTAEDGANNRKTIAFNVMDPEKRKPFGRALDGGRNWKTMRLQLYQDLSRP